MTQATIEAQRRQPDLWLVPGLFAAALTLGATESLAVGQPSDEAPVLVTSTEVRHEAVRPSVPSAGTVFNRYGGQVTAGIAGRLTFIAQPGDRVKRNGVLARFDCSAMELRREEQALAAQREQINFSAFSQELARLEKMPGLISELRIDQVRASRDLAKNAEAMAMVRVQQTDQELTRCVARAPVSGVVTMNGFQIGEDVPVGAVLAAVTDTANLEVRAAMPVRYLPRMSAGAAAEVRLDGSLLAGTVRTVVPAADPLSQTFEVRIDLPPEAPALLAAGQLVSVRLALDAQAALTVPRDAVVLRADGAYVMRIDPFERVEEIAVELGDAGQQRVVVRGALAAGDRLALRGAEALRQGQQVEVFTDS
ncbi:MAG: efflux RND transporter periplasmic adaptor subunit [Pseudomonadota bacterium]